LHYSAKYIGNAVFSKSFANPLIQNRESIVKTGEASNLLGVDIKTLKNWISHELLSQFFSEGARAEHGSPHRVLTESDVLVLNTIRHLRTSGITEWTGIAEYLESGKREQSFPQNAIAVDTRTIPLPQAEQSAKAMATMAERDAAMRRVQELESQLSKVETKNAEQNAEIIRLNREIGKLEGLLEALRNDKK
jgi:DNA-binding transcriptional MerR regulator